ncbi:endonuclease III [bacterium]|jgi:endonuclease III|nr:endonuclease III [bacterium]
MKTSERAQKIFATLRKETSEMPETLVTTVMKEFGQDPFFILISCLLSLRSRDTRTVHVCRTLFSKIRTPQQLLEISRVELEKIVFSLGFYRQRAKTLHEVSQIMIDDFFGKVPSDPTSLRALPGVGLKTSNLVLGIAFGVPAICVDVHVHRISKRLGLVETKNPDKTEAELKKVLPQNLWTEWNDLLVKLGQNICLPRKPKCRSCPISGLCKTSSNY